MPLGKRSKFVYLVRNYEQQDCGVYSTLELAAMRYKTVITEELSGDDRAALVSIHGEDFHDALEYPACIVVYQLDAGEVWSYDSVDEVDSALLVGEDLDNYT